MPMYSYQEPTVPPPSCPERTSTVSPLNTVTPSASVSLVVYVASSSHGVTRFQSHENS